MNNKLTSLIAGIGLMLSTSASLADVEAECTNPNDPEAINYQHAVVVCPGIRVVRQEFRNIAFPQDPVLQDLMGQIQLNRPTESASDVGGGIPTVPNCRVEYTSGVPVQVCD